MEVVSISPESSSILNFLAVSSPIIIPSYNIILLKILLGINSAVFAVLFNLVFKLAGNNLVSNIFLAIIR